MQRFVIVFVGTIWLPYIMASQPKAEAKVDYLADFETAKAADGWVVISTVESPKQQNALVHSKGGFKALVKKQKVTLKYTWIVVAQSAVPAETEKTVTFSFNSSDSVESKFEIQSDLPANTLELDVSNKPCEAIEGTSIKLMIQTSSKQKKLVLGVQQAIQIYSDEEPPRLLETGYLGRYGTVVLEKKIN